MLWISGTRPMQMVIVRGPLQLALESVGRKEVTSRSGRKEENGPLPGTSASCASAAHSAAWGRNREDRQLLSVGRKLAGPGLQTPLRSAQW